MEYWRNNFLQKAKSRKLLGNSQLTPANGKELISHNTAQVVLKDVKGKWF